MWFCHYAIMQIEDIMEKLFGYEDIVAFDLETTGLDPYSNSIIEIGAIRLLPDGEFEHFSTLVKPQKPVPFYVMQLTGIDNEMLVDAPDINSALAQFIEFIGNATLIAHNAQFDMDFIGAKIAENDMNILQNPVIDTLSLSRILFPNLINHRLESVAGLFGYKLRDAHRALDDAEATLISAIGLWKTLLAMDDKNFDMLEYLIGSANMTDLLEIWGSARMARVLTAYEPPAVEEKFLLDLTNEFGEVPSGTVQFQPDEIMGYFDENSPLGRVLDNFKFRIQQRDMAERIISALANGELVMIEAGTGVGKSFAYLIPSLYWAIANGEKVVISTYTKALQEQLFFSDLPMLSEVLPFDFRAILLKGKGNYICLRRARRYLDDPSVLSYNERTGMIYIARWLAGTHSGDISENSAFINSKQFYLWEKIRSDGHTCIGKKCPYYQECFVYSIRSKVKDAQVVVVNHALLLSDLAGGILGDYNYLVVDEAHNLERVAADAFGGEIARWRVYSVLDSIFSEMPNPTGTLAFLYSKIPNRNHYKEYYKEATNSIIAARGFANTFFTELTETMEKVYHWREQKYGVRNRYDSGNPVFQQIETFGTEMIRCLSRVRDSLKEFYDAIGEEDEEIIRLSEELRGEADKVEEILEDFLFAINPGEPNFVYWMESPTSNDSENATAKLCFAPLNIGEILNKSLYEHLGAAILTSATMTVAGNFNYFIDSLGFNFAPQERIDAVLYGSPYDYDSQLKIVVGKFMPYPSRKYEKVFIQKLSQIVWEISQRFRLGTLVLFTSHSMLRDVYFDLHPKFKGEGLRLLGQNLSGSHQAIKRQFIDDVESVLLGTESFWQGINVPGKSLEALFLVKLPFGVPGEPYTDAKQEQIRIKGGNPFMEYVVPQSVIRFRQGIGRLIRSETDRGVLIILDPRISGKNYSEEFLKSLPTKPIMVNSEEELFDIISEQFASR